MTDRRTFLHGLAAAALGTRALPGMHHARHSSAPMAHPTPRPGYTAAKVMTAAQLGGYESLIELFDGVRAFPHLADGIRCSCGCADWENMYSLLSCYEGPEAMATWCPVCQGTGRLLVRLARQGRTLDQIRAAIDARR